MNINDKPQPVLLSEGGVAADGVVLVGNPDDEDDVECGGSVVEELRHYGFHAFVSIEKLINQTINQSFSQPINLK